MSTFTLQFLKRDDEADFETLKILHSKQRRRLGKNEGVRCRSKWKQKEKAGKAKKECLMRTSEKFFSATIVPQIIPQLFF